MPNSLINVSIAAEALPWIYLAIMTITLAAAVVAVFRHGRAATRAIPAEPNAYLLRVSRTDGYNPTYMVTFDNGRHLSAKEAERFQELYRRLHPADGTPDPYTFVQSVLDAHYEETGIRGRIYSTPVTRTFLP